MVWRLASVGIASISYDEESTKLINMRNQGAMLSDPTIREGYVQGSVARGMEAAGSNAAGSVSGFMGMGMSMQSGSGVMGAASEANLRQMEMNRQHAQADMAAATWICSCGTENTRKILCGMWKTDADCVDLFLWDRKYRKILYGMWKTGTGGTVDLFLWSRKYRKILCRMWKTESIRG